MPPADTAGRACASFRQPDTRIGAYYLAGSAVASLSALLLPLVVAPFFVFVATSLAVVAAAYFGLGPRVYGKRDGRVPMVRRLFLAPALIGQRASLAYYRRRTSPWSQVTETVAMGARLPDVEAARLVQDGVTAVLDLTADFSEAQPFLQGAYRNVPILDLTAPTPPQLAEAVAFVREQARRGKVYVHCKIGFSRSAAVVGAYLLEEGLAVSVEEAVAALRKARPGIVVRPEAWEAMRNFRARPG